MSILCRSVGKLAIHASAGAQEPSFTIQSASNFVASTDGTRVFVSTPTTVEVYSTQAPFDKVASVAEPGVVLMALSPAGQYLITCQKPQKVEGEPVKNLKVWQSSNLTPVFSYFLKTVSKDAWPAISWAGDDSAFAVAVPNAAHVFSKEDNFASFTKVTIKNLSSLALCPTTVFGRIVAGFIPENKGSPASSGLYDASKAGEPQPRVKKAFFRTQGAKLTWNSSGTALLVMSFADFDVTNQSYYGEQKLHYLSADPARADAATTVPLPKDGPVHDVQWSPAGDYFLTVAGFMPAKVTLWDAQCKPIFDFGSGPYNMVRWNPFGRFLAVAGFGNLPGDILFFDKKASGTCKQMGATRSPAVSLEWSPDGRQVLIATTAPRLRVDNKAQVLDYTGVQVSNMPYDVLFEASWLGAPEGVFQHRAPSPERLTAAQQGMSSTPGAKGAAAVMAAKPAGYVPPHARGANGAGTSAPVSFSLGFDASDRGGRISAAAAAAGLPVTARPSSAKGVPGFDFVDAKAASKNAKRRSKKKGGDDGGEDCDGQAPQQQQSAAGGGVQDVTQGVAGVSVGGDAGEQDVGKKIRNLQKKLRQVQQLKEKLQKEGEKALEPEQLQKVQTEGALIAEIQALGGSV